MAIEHRKRAGRTPALTLSAAALALALSACGDFLPEGGYDKVAYRDKDEIPAAVAPAPPPVVAGIGAGAAAEVPQLPAGAPAGVIQAMVEEGAQLFSTSCAACHGAGGAGTPAAPSLQDADWINISGGFDEIVNIIHTGVPAPKQFAAAMPPLGGGSFDEEQVRALAAYVFALSHAQ